MLKRALEVAALGAAVMILIGPDLLPGLPTVSLSSTDDRALDVAHRQTQRPVFMDHIETLMQSWLDSPQLEYSVKAALGRLSYLLPVLTVDELNVVAEFVAGPHAKAKLGSMDASDLGDIAKQALDRLESMTEIGVVDPLCRLLSLVMGALRQYHTLQLVDSVVQRAWQLAQRPRYVLRAHRDAACILDVLAEVLADTALGSATRYKQLATRFANVDVRLAQLVDLADLIRPDPIIQYHLHADFGEVLRHDPWLSFEARLGSDLTEDLFRAVEGLWLSWASFVWKARLAPSRPWWLATAGPVLPADWQVQLRAQTGALLARVRSEANHLVSDLHLLQDSERLQAALALSSQFDTPSSETIASLAALLDSAHGDDVAVLIRVLEPLLFRLEKQQSLRPSQVASVIGDVVVSRLARLARDPDDQHVICEFLQRTLRRLQDRGPVTTGWEPVLVAILRDVDVVVSGSELIPWPYHHYGRKVARRRLAAIRDPKAKSSASSVPLPSRERVTVLDVLVQAGDDQRQPRWWSGADPAVLARRELAVEFGQFVDGHVQARSQRELVRDLLRRCRQSARAVLATLTPLEADWPQVADRVRKVAHLDEFSPEAVLWRYFDLYRDWNNVVMALKGWPIRPYLPLTWSGVLRARLAADLTAIIESEPASAVATTGTPTDVRHSVANDARQRRVRFPETANELMQAQIFNKFAAAADLGEGSEAFDVSAQEPAGDDARSEGHGPESDHVRSQTI